MNSSIHKLADGLTDLLCLSSIVGIWPRFIETSWLEVTELELFLDQLPSSFDGFRFVHLSDLHFNAKTSKRLLRKVQQKLEQLRPELIIFTGDFICYAQLAKDDELLRILRGWRRVAPVLACLGNHDYEHYVSQRNGLAYIHKSPKPFIIRALRRLFFHRKHPKAQEYLHQGQNLNAHPHLLQLLSDAGITLLQNNPYCLNREGQSLLFWGVDDLWAGGCHLQQSLAELKQHLKDPVCCMPIIMAHNPDSADLMSQTPASLILSGHTHGGNINLPWVRSRIRSVRNLKRLRGLHVVGQHLLYVNRGLGNPYPLRLKSRPELTLICLQTPKPKNKFS